MATVTNENVVPNSQEETTSPLKPAISPRDIKAANTPSTEAASPDAAAIVADDAEEAASPDSAATLECDAEEAAKATFVIGEKVRFRDFGGKRWFTGIVKSLSPLKTTGEDNPHAAGYTWDEVEKIEVPAAPAEEDLELQCYLPKLGSDLEVQEESPSWIWRDLSAEADDARYAEAGFFMGSVVSILHRSPSYDPEVKVAAFSRLSQEDSDSEEEFENAVGLSKLERECASAAAHNVAEEKWRLMLNERFAAFAPFAPALAHMMPQGPTTFF